MLKELFGRSFIAHAGDGNEQDVALVPDKGGRGEYE
jgi:hypothetical protein